MSWIHKALVLSSFAVLVFAVTAIFQHADISETAFIAPDILIALSGLFTVCMLARELDNHYLLRLQFWYMTLLLGHGIMCAFLIKVTSQALPLEICLFLSLFSVIILLWRFRIYKSKIQLFFEPEFYRAYNEI